MALGSYLRVFCGLIDTRNALIGADCCLNRRDCLWKFALNDWTLA